MIDKRIEIADTLRGRLYRGLQAGTITRGNRLPSARDLKKEFGVDHRLILDAYRELEREGLIELRARGGVYVAADLALGAVPLPSASWLVDFFTQSVAREIPLAELHDWLRRAVETRRLRAVAIHSTTDTIAGLIRELRDDYGLDATGLHIDTLIDAEDVPSELRYADVVVTTPGLAGLVLLVAERYKKKLIVAEIRADLIGGDWRLLMRRPVYVIVKDEKFLGILEEFFGGVPGADNIRPVVLGRDSLDTIPEGAPVYVTRGARDALGGASVRGRILPAARLFSPETSREIIQFIVTENLRAMQIEAR